MKGFGDKYLLKVLESVREQYSIEPIMKSGLYGEIEKLCKGYLEEEKYFEFYMKLEELESKITTMFEEIVFIHGFKTGVRVILASLDKLEGEHITG